jgi:hypothetical protein
MADTRSSEQERGLFRPEVFDYQRRRAFGEPVDIRPLSPLWCLVPASALIALCASLSLLTYQPSLAAQVSADPEGQTGRVSMVNQADLLGELRPGGELRFEVDHRPYSMQILERGTAPCGPAMQCLEVKGRFLDQSAGAQLGAGATATLRLPPRSLLAGWKR